MSSPAEGTRERILRATLDLMEAQDGRGVTVAEIAEEAGVSRQAVYLHFGSRTGLMLALVEWVDDNLGIPDAVSEAMCVPDPVARFETLLRAAAEFEPRLAALARLVDTARDEDDAARAAWEDRMEQRKAAFTTALEDVASAGALRADLTPRRAAEIVWNLGSPASYRNLVLDSGWTHAEWADFVVDAARALVLAPE